ncbi:hypothetical protein [Clostridium tagluense]|uniref:hypothetical protein n=1 Tax=Clostridium tagluense TaxID=360422 RepID=UPI001CF3875F|nr:hypothetical protein [Clostridium tagluense]MCB2297810.1 hypothetical protein [Clostridium tagluense]
MAGEIFIADKATLDSVKADTNALKASLAIVNADTDDLQTNMASVKATGASTNSNEITHYNAVTAQVATVKADTVSLMSSIANIKSETALIKADTTALKASLKPFSFFTTDVQVNNAQTVTIFNISGSGVLKKAIISGANGDAVFTFRVIVDGTNVYYGQTVALNTSIIGILQEDSSITGSVGGTARGGYYARTPGSIGNDGIMKLSKYPYTANTPGVAMATIITEGINFNSSLVIQVSLNSTVYPSYPITMETQGGVY